MQAASNPIGLEDSYLGLEQQTDKITIHGEGANLARKKSQQEMNLIEKEAGKDEREMDEKV